MEFASDDYKRDLIVEWYDLTPHGHHICLSLSSTIPFLIKINGRLLVEKMGVSLENSMSLAKCVFRNMNSEVVRRHFFFLRHSNIFHYSQYFYVGHFAISIELQYLMFPTRKSTSKFQNAIFRHFRPYSNKSFHFNGYV